MNDDERINDLRQRIDLLAQKIELFQEEVQSLRNELYRLQEKKHSNRPASQSTIDPRGMKAVNKPANALENFIGLRFMHIVGIVVLVIGLSIGVKYAIDRQLISEGMRVTLAYLAGAVLFVLSVLLKKKYRLFSAILFSGSMASVYFTTYAAFVYYHFFPLAVAFVMMIGLTVYTVITAVNYDRQEIAILGMIGAYGIPFLISANADRVDLFFSYILLINLGVAFISFRRSWKWMQYLALVITWVLFIGWAVMRYQDSLRATGLLFMIAFYILLFVSALARPIRRGVTMTWQEIQQIILNNTLLYLAAVLVFGGWESNLDATTGFFALFIGLLAMGFYMLLPRELVLQKLTAWQAIILLVMFIGFRWDGVTVTLLWVAVAVFLFGWGIIYKRSWPRLAAILLIGITLAKLILLDSSNFSTIQKIISFLVIGILLLLFSFYYQKFNLSNNKQAKE